MSVVTRSLLTASVMALASAVHAQPLSSEAFAEAADGGGAVDEVLLTGNPLRI